MKKELIDGWKRKHTVFSQVCSDLLFLEKMVFGHFSWQSCILPLHRTFIILQINDWRAVIRENTVCSIKITQHFDTLIIFTVQLIFAFVLFYFTKRWRIIGWRGKRPDLYLGYVNLTKVIFRPVKRLKLIGSLFRERSANWYSVLSERIQQSS